MRRKQNTQNFFWTAAAGLLAMILLLSSAAIYHSYGQYQEKIKILNELMGGSGEEEERLDTAIELLRDGPSEGTESNSRSLEEYGYFKPGANYYSREFCRETMGIAGTALSCAVLSLFLLAVVEHGAKRQREKEMNLVSDLVEQFQKQNYQAANHWDMEETETPWMRIREQFCSLGERLKLQEEQSRREKEETKSLVTDISHQLKTPLAALKACFEILLQENLTPRERREFEERCEKQLDGLDGLLNALLNISRMETGMVQITKKCADIFETIVSAISRVYLKAEQKQISIELEEGEEPPSIWICHDVKWTCEALINLLENAVKYSPPQSTVRIRMQKRQAFLRIEIEDEGIGVPKEEYHKIFQRFYRGHSQQVRQEEGSGIGLYLTRELLARQGGSVMVTSRTGSLGKTIFVVQLPWEG